MGVIRYSQSINRMHFVELPGQTTVLVSQSITIGFTYTHVSKMAPFFNYFEN